LLAGLAILCKVHGVFLWVSIGLFVLLYERRHLSDRNLYLGAAVTAIVISPILIWNFQNDFVTYRFHSGRVGMSGAWIHPDYFFQAIAGQLVYSNPVNAALILVAAWRLKTMKFLSEGAVVTFMALFNPMLPHWSGPAMMVLSFLAAAWLDERKTVSEISRDSRLLTTSAITVGALVILTVLLIHVYPGTFGKHDKKRFGEDDFTLDLSGWGRFSGSFREWLTAEEQSGRLPYGLPIVSNKWFPAAHIEYYVARPLDRPVIGVGRVVDLHQYNWLNLERPTLAPGDSALCIVPSNYPMILHESYYLNFTSIDLLRVFYSYRGGRMSRYFTVYLLKGYKGNDEAHQPPFTPAPAK
jgi:Dolichyl-phosphate-mannose-protein mannosyltransferase